MLIVSRKEKCFLNCTLLFSGSGLGPISLRKSHVFKLKTHIGKQECSNLASDWLAAMLPANQRPGLKSLLTNLGFNMDFSQYCLCPLDSFAVSLHSPKDRHLPADKTRVKKGTDYQWLLKNWKFPPIIWAQKALPLRHSQTTFRSANQKKGDV